MSAEREKREGGVERFTQNRKEFDSLRKRTRNELKRRRKKRLSIYSTEFQGVRLDLRWKVNGKVELQIGDKAYERGSDFSSLVADYALISNPKTAFRKWKGETKEERNLKASIYIAKNRERLEGELLGHARGALRNLQRTKLPDLVA